IPSTMGRFVQTSYRKEVEEKGPIPRANGNFFRGSIRRLLPNKYGNKPRQYGGESKRNLVQSERPGSYQDSLNAGIADGRWSKWAVGEAVIITVETTITPTIVR